VSRLKSGPEADNRLLGGCDMMAAETVELVTAPPVSRSGPSAPDAGG
jgi:hypothetical protein